MLNNTERKVKSATKVLVKAPHIPKKGNTVNLLLDLGVSYGITSGYNTLSRRNIEEFIKLSWDNSENLDEKAVEVYITDICRLKKTLETIEEYKDNIRFGELCKVYDEIRRNNRIKPSEQTEFMRSITSKLKNHCNEDLDMEIN